MVRDTIVFLSLQFLPVFSWLTFVNVLLPRPHYEYNWKPHSLSSLIENLCWKKLFSHTRALSKRCFSRLSRASPEIKSWIRPWFLSLLFWQSIHTGNLHRVHVVEIRCIRYNCIYNVFLLKYYFLHFEYVLKILFPE